MDAGKTDRWLQMLGMIGIIASLIFVGFQLKQTQDIAIAGQYQERATAAQAFYEFRASHDVQLQTIGARHREHLETAAYYDGTETIERIATDYFVARTQLMIYDNNFYQYQSGFLTEEAWEPYLGLVELLCARNGPAAILMRNHPDQFRKSFRDLCMGFMD